MVGNRSVNIYIRGILKCKHLGGASCLGRGGLNISVSVL
jgi:hypothetical protein